MKKLVTLVLLLVVLAFYAFTKITPHMEYPEITFPERLELQGRTIPLDTVLFRYPYRFRVKEDRVIIEDLHGVDHFFHLFTYPDFRYLSSFGQRGEGPEEMLTVDDGRWLGGSFLGLDNIKSELVRWKLNEDRNQMLRTESIKLDKATFRALDFVPYQDGSFLIPNYSGDTRFCEVDRKGKLLKKWGKIPTDNPKLLEQNPNVFGQGWRSFVDYSFQSGILVAATQLGEVLEIWNTQRGTYQIIKGELGDPKFEIVQSYAIPSGFRGYNDVHVTERAIYGIYNGVPMKEVMLAYQKGKPLPEGGRTVRVFGLDGKPLKEYKLDHSVSGIWVDEKLGKMWALDVNSDDPIVEYTLK